ncbi:type II CAAX endopeptidase family protein [Pontibacter sp. G13]|uniref:CPBP family intramembrane glutamic endopeptidase n=1 Tax=Pontibacter sp. G13 TaxID=3074898 RepID=UPI00288B5549|nr:type II CAAX endopeptidase family protein [Pontibacter sp. G13]WNJ17438.1 type II CAAX endopeptidase family protein [Pontibacter sp. G13]
MIGILVGLAISWILLFLIEKKHILALGFLPIPRRAKQFAFGFLITGTLCALAQCFEAYLKGADWVFYEHISGATVLEALFWDFKSVVTEELIFRGALLYILIQKLGSTKAIWISAIAFGIYHWFSFDILGNVLPMIFVFIATGLMGFAWAYAFSKTRSIMLPIGLHLGWNAVHNTIFSKGPLGEIILKWTGGSELTDWSSLLNFTASSIVVPILLIIWIRYVVKEETEVVPAMELDG